MPRSQDTPNPIPVAALWREQSKLGGRLVVLRVKALLMLQPDGYQQKARDLPLSQDKRERDPRMTVRNDEAWTKWVK
jgi:hypothetical protein